MGKYSLGLVLLLLWVLPAAGQYRPEREHRIKKTQFPDAALSFMDEHIQHVRRKRYYMETDSSTTSYRVKFRKGRLRYRAWFDEEGQPEAVDFGITETDVPNETMARMTAYLENTFSKYHLRAFMQQYVLTAGEPLDEFLKKAFQNLLLPDIRYEMLLSGKQNNVYADYEIIFDAGGNLVSQRKALPLNLDHVLY